MAGPLIEMKGKKATATLPHLPHKKSTTTASIRYIQREGTAAILATLPWAGIEGEKKFSLLPGTFSSFISALNPLGTCEIQDIDSVQMCVVCRIDHEILRRVSL